MVNITNVRLVQDRFNLNVMKMPAGGRLQLFVLESMCFLHHPCWCVASIQP